MMLDPDTGLDPPGIRIRAAQGLDAASYFITGKAFLTTICHIGLRGLSGYWIWSKIIENLAVLEYDHNDLALAAYDWRLAYSNLQLRCVYFLFTLS
jgi:phospholipid:diacylglycerol acyltransferase